MFDSGLIWFWFWFDGGLTVVALFWVFGSGGFLVLILAGFYLAEVGDVTE